jgi:hypothetical protein
MSGGEAYIGIGMQNAWYGNPAVKDRCQSIPR